VFGEQSPDIEAPVKPDVFPEEECDESMARRGSKARTLLWSEVEDQTHCIFHLWGSPPEVDRARRAWGCVVEAGLADYDTPTEETRARIRLLAIAAIFLECRFGSWKDQYSPILEEGLTDLEITPSHISQLAGVEGRLAEQVLGVESRGELVRGLVTALIEAEIPVLSRVIEAGPGSAWRHFVEVCDALGLPDQTREAVRNRLAEMARPWAHPADDDQGPRGLSDAFLASAHECWDVSEEEVLRLAADCLPHNEWTKDLRQQYLGLADRVMLMTRGVLEEDDVYPPSIRSICHGLWI